MPTQLLLADDDYRYPDAEASVRYYQPQGNLVRAWSSRQPEVVTSGPAGTGKSRLWLERLDYQARKYPGMRGLIVRKTRASLTESALVTMERDVLPSGDPMATAQLRRVRTSYDYPNGSTLVVGGLDQASRIMSTEWDTVFVQEATELAEDEWEALNSRLRSGVLPYQQMTGDCNPDAPHHWIKQRSARGMLTLIETVHEDNPRYFNPDGSMTDAGRDYIAVLDRLSGIRKQRLRQGLWVAAQGAIYELWEPALHVIEPFKIPSDWTRFRTVDFGFVHPFVCQWWALDDDQRLYLYREVFGTYKLVEDWAHLIFALSQNELISATVCDHDAEGRATLERHLTHNAADCDPNRFGGGSTSPADKANVNEGIDRVAARMKRQKDGKPRLFLFRDARLGADPLLLASHAPTCTEDEIPSYVWDRQSGRLGDRIVQQPRKWQDDGCDAMRYAAGYADDPLRQYASVMGQHQQMRRPGGPQESPWGLVREQMERNRQPNRKVTW
jgi:hypothetical protein